MTTWKNADEYGEVIKLVATLGGTMEWKQGGYGGGGNWVLDLCGKKLTVRISQHDQLNVLDNLYVPTVPNPTTWAEFTSTLVPDAFWRLVRLDDWQ